MNRNAGDKRLKSVLLVYLMLAIIGSFAFSICQDFSFETANKDTLGSGNNISSVTHAIDWLAEDTLIVSKAHKFSNSTVRNGLLRIFTLAGIITIAMIPAQSNLRKYKNNNFPEIKNLVPLKLRI